ncbi:methyltransferase domain-containing protein [Cylindrospermopsis raciborskii]|uniref:methyltransferase domain-containing protein n=1 Tax=Cylindrospermopsis raciborskii TaxID=77022 RepID=UPI003DA49492
MYRHSPSSTLWPPLWEDIWHGKVNAVLANSVLASDLWYSLPYSSQYEEDTQKENSELVDFMVQNCGDLSNAKIVDAGCGKGGLLSLIHARFPSAELYGIEQSRVALGFIQANRRYIKPILFDVNNPVPLVDVDVVVSVDTIEHLEHPKTAIISILEMLAEGGTAIFTVPNGRYDSTPQHINFWSPESWRSFMKEIKDSSALKYDVTTSLIADSNMPGGNRNIAIIRK